MKELLDKLKSLDSTTYKRFDEETIATRWIYMPDGGEDVESYGCHLSESAQMAWLQACLQEAIGGKGWQGIVLFNKECNRAVIEDIIDGWGGTRKLSEEIGSSPVESLLAAYIAACEAMT